MFVVDQAPARVLTTPAASAHLAGLAAQLGEVTVLLSDERAQVLPRGEHLPAGSVHLGRLDESVSFVADGAASTPWWRNRATVDLRGDSMSVALSPLSDAEVFDALASGPLPRY